MFKFLKNKYLLFSVILITVFIFFSCSGDGKTVGETTPSNLVITTHIVGANPQNLNGDGSGTVNFNITAKNATFYKIVVGNGEILESTTGVFSYTYTASGTNTYVIYVSAYNGVKFVSTSTSIVVYVTTVVPILVWSDEFNVEGAPNS